MNIYKHLAVAVALSPRLQPLLNETALQTRALSDHMSLIHVGTHDRRTESELRSALVTAGLPDDVPIIWKEGSADTALLDAATEHDVDLLVAGALERERGLKYYLGSVARNLVREATFSLLLFTRPRLDPVPLSRAVMVTDYSENSLIALVKLVRFAEAHQLETVYVVRALPDFGDAIVTSEGMRRDQERSFRRQSVSEEDARLRDFLDAVGGTTVPLLPKCLVGHSGYEVSSFAREQQADLLVMPSSNHKSRFFERLFPSDMEWVLREIPCNLWVARDLPPLA